MAKMLRCPKCHGSSIKIDTWPALVVKVEEFSTIEAEIHDRLIQLSLEHEGEFDYCTCNDCDRVFLVRNGGRNG